MSTIEFRVPDDVRWDAHSLRQFSENAPYYLDGARVVSCTGRQLELFSPEPLENALFRQNAEALVRSIGLQLRDAEEVLLHESIFTRSALNDPMIDLIRQGDAKQIRVGQFAYSGRLLSLLHSLDRLFEKLANDFGAQAHAYPSTVSADTLIRSGYLKSFPQHAYFVAPVGLSSDKLKRVTQCTSVGQLDAGLEGVLIAPHEQVLAPTVCYHCFEALAGQNLNRFSCFTAVGPCHRHEIVGGDSLSRLHTFRMREVIAFGSADYVAGVLDALLDATRQLLIRWQISHRIMTANDPFFAGAPGNKLFFQSAFALKREIRIRTDFDDQWLAAASFNNHQKSLASVFSIRAANTDAESGCVGWGFERLAYALMSQLGADTRSWPSVVRDELEI